jgi:hypothetical protein
MDKMRTWEIFKVFWKLKMEELESLFIVVAFLAGFLLLTVIIGLSVDLANEYLLWRVMVIGVLSESLIRIGLFTFSMLLFSLPVLFFILVANEFIGWIKSNWNHATAMVEKRSGHEGNAS